MKIKAEDRLKLHEVEEEGAQGVSKAVLIGPEDGSRTIVLRSFKVEPGGQTPLHTHDWEHLVRVERGEGVVYSGADGKFKVEPGKLIFIPSGEEHQFLNPYSEPFEFLCIIPNPGR